MLTLPFQSAIFQLCIFIFRPFELAVACIQEDSHVCHPTADRSLLVSYALHLCLHPEEAKFGQAMLNNHYSTCVCSPSIQNWTAFHTGNCVVYQIATEPHRLFMINLQMDVIQTNSHGRSSSVIKRQLVTLKNEITLNSCMSCASKSA